MLYRGLFVGMRPGLFTDQTHFTHQRAHLVTTDANAVIIEQFPDAATARGTSALFERLSDHDLQRQPFSVNDLAPFPVGVVTGARNIKYITDQFYRFLLSQLVY